MRSRSASGLPSTVMISLSRTLTAGLASTAPFTATRPCMIHCSASRREQARRGPSPWRRVRLRMLFLVARPRRSALAFPRDASRTWPRGTFRNAVCSPPKSREAACLGPACLDVACLDVAWPGTAWVDAPRRRWPPVRRRRGIVDAWVARRPSRGRGDVSVFHRSCALIAGKAAPVKGRSVFPRFYAGLALGAQVDPTIQRMCTPRAANAHNGKCSMRRYLIFHVGGRKTLIIGGLP